MDTFVKNPKVTFITPIYNAERWIDGTVECCLRQTDPNWELVAVDDGSTDNSLAILQAWAEKDGRVRVFHKENGGQAKARAFGLERSTGDYVFYLDQDDRISDNLIEACMSAIHANGADAAIPNLIQRSDKEVLRNNFEVFGIADGTVITGQEAFERSINWNGVWAFMMYRADIYKRYACDERFLYGNFNSDELIARIAMMNCNKVAYCSAEYYYSIHQESMSKTMSPRMFGYLETHIHLIQEAQRFGQPRSVVAKAEVTALREMVELWQQYKNGGKSLSKADSENIEGQFASFHARLPKGNINEMLSTRPGITPKLQRLLMLHSWPLCKISLTLAAKMGMKNKLYPWFSEEQIKSLK